MTTETKPSRATLTHVQFFKLCTWMQTADLSGVHTKAEAARRASAGLGFEVSEHTIGNALQSTGVKLPEPPQAEPRRRDRSVIVAQALVAFMHSAGYEPPEDLVKVSRSQSL